MPSIRSHLRLDESVKCKYFLKGYQHQGFDAFFFLRPIAALDLVYCKGFFTQKSWVLLLLTQVKFSTSNRSPSLPLTLLNSVRGLFSDASRKRRIQLQEHDVCTNLSAFVTNVGKSMFYHRLSTNIVDYGLKFLTFHRAFAIFSRQFDERRGGCQKDGPH